MKEIGGYLELEKNSGADYFSDLIHLNTANNALMYLCRAKNIKKLYIPYFLCDSVSIVCEKNYIEYEYYNINADFTPYFNKILEKGEWLYIVNYYGQLSTELIMSYKKRFNNIILDNVQAFFTSPLRGIDTIYSCRKFFGVPDGALLSSDAPTLDLETDISKDRMTHILGRFDTDCASDYYSKFRDNDHELINLPLRYMSKLTRNLLCAIDYEAVKQKRNENWDTLHSLLATSNKLVIVKPEAPYVYPFYSENAKALRELLARKKIYIPTLWPNVFDFSGCELEKEFAEKILPLPIDQRYDMADMKTIVSEINIAEIEITKNTL